MQKIEVAAERICYPMPCSLVGANVGGKANFITIAWFTMVNPKPPYVLATMNTAHSTNQGVKENGTFSVNIPSVDIVEKTDYCGLVSGRKYDKSTVFDTFYGRLRTAPMIAESAFSAECRLVQTVDLPMEELFIGEIVGAYSEERYMTDGIPDLKKMKPFILMQTQKQYTGLGPDIAPAWEAGRKLIK